MPGIKGNREERPSTPFEGYFLRVVLLPHFRGTAPFHDIVDLLVEVAFGVQRSSPRHFDDIHPPKPFRAQELNGGTPATQSLPRLERQVRDLMHADVAVYRDPLSFNEEIIGRLRIFPLTEARFFASFRFAPIEQLCIWLDAHGIALLKRILLAKFDHVSLNYLISFPLVNRKPARAFLEIRCLAALSSRFPENSLQAAQKDSEVRRTKIDERKRT